MKEFTQTAIVVLIMSSIIVGIMFTWALEEPTGHYEGTEVKQPDGTYYVWVSDD